MKVLFSLLLFMLFFHINGYSASATSKVKITSGVGVKSDRDTNWETPLFIHNGKSNYKWYAKGKYGVGKVSMGPTLKKEKFASSSVVPLVTKTTWDPFDPCWILAANDELKGEGRGTGNYNILSDFFGKAAFSVKSTVKTPPGQKNYLKTKCIDPWLFLASENLINSDSMSLFIPIEIDSCLFSQDGTDTTFCSIKVSYENYLGTQTLLSLFLSNDTVVASNDNNLSEPISYYYLNYLEDYLSLQNSNSISLSDIEADLASDIIGDNSQNNPIIIGIYIDKIIIPEQVISSDTLFKIHITTEAVAIAEEPVNTPTPSPMPEDTGCCCRCDNDNQFVEICETTTKAECEARGIPPHEWIPNCECGKDINIGDDCKKSHKIPTLSQWGLILLTLLLFSLSTVALIRRRQSSLQIAGTTTQNSPSPLFDRTTFKQIFLKSIPFIAAIFLVISFAEGGFFLRNLLGTLLSDGIIAYVVHFIVLSESKDDTKK